MIWYTRVSKCTQMNQNQMNKQCQSSMAKEFQLTPKSQQKCWHVSEKVACAGSGLEFNEYFISKLVSHL